jgi:hypothetical protein
VGVIPWALFPVGVIPGGRYSAPPSKIMLLTSL